MKHWYRSSISLIATFALVLNVLATPLAAFAQGISSSQVITDTSITADPVTEVSTPTPEATPETTDKDTTSEAEEGATPSKEESSEEETSETAEARISSDSVITEDEDIDFDAYLEPEWEEVATLSVSCEGPEVSYDMSAESEKYWFISWHWKKGYDYLTLCENQDIIIPAEIEITDDHNGSSTAYLTFDIDNQNKDLICAYKEDDDVWEFDKCYDGYSSALKWFGSSTNDEAGDVVEDVKKIALQVPEKHEGAVTIEVFKEIGIDFGDAPDSYKTLLASDGASHDSGTNLYLGSKIDYEDDGVPTADADGDDLADEDDEDGLIHIDPLQQGDIAKVEVSVNGDGGYLNAWIDYNLDGDWDDNLEHVVIGESVSSGTETFYILVPANATIGETYMRLRLSTTQDLSSFGPAADGEVEDYKVEVTQPVIWGYKWFDADQDGFWDKADDGKWEYQGEGYRMGRRDNHEEWPIDNWLIVAKNEADAPIWEEEIEANDGGVDDGEDSPVLEDGKIYLIEAEGTFYSGYTGPTTLSAQDHYDEYLDVVADAEYISNDDWGSYDNPADLELTIDDEHIDWGSYNDDHLYKYVYIGEGKSINFSIFEEQYEWYQDNFGLLTVRIYDVTNSHDRTDTNGYYEIPVEAGEYQVVEQIYGRWETTSPTNPSYCHLTTGDNSPKNTLEIMSIQDQYSQYNTECSFGNYQEPRDYGDAPQHMPQEKRKHARHNDSWGFPTTDEKDGAYHVIDWGFHLGDGIDMEEDGQPTLLAEGDDNEYSDDEDGVIFTSPIIPNEFATVEVTATGTGLLDAWIDFNDDGDWDDDGEKIFAYEGLEYGVNELTYFVPADVAAGEAPYARFRFSTDGSESPYGRAEDGEVEDYLVQINEGTSYDYAPYCGDGEVNQEWEDCDPGADIRTRTLSTEPVCNNQCQFTETNQCKDLVLTKITIDEVKNWNGGNMENDIYLGDATAKIPNNVWFPVYWNGYYFDDPDVEEGNYEDVPGLAVQRGYGNIRVVMHASHSPEYQNYGNDDEWTDIDEDAYITAAGGGGHANNYGLPKEHVNGVISFSNSYPTLIKSDEYDNKIERYDDGAGLDQYRAKNDEVFIDLEQVIFHITANKYDDGFYVDYEDTIYCEDFGDAPESYPTLLNADPFKDGARHVISSLTLGDYRDGETDGQPVPAGAGDDLNGLVEFQGNPVEDEDGVEFVGGKTITANTTKEIKVNIEGDGYLDAWVDFNGDGDWSEDDGTDDVGEKIFHSYPLSPGTTTLSFHVPWYVQPGETYARFRISTEGGLFPYGPAYDGEVEDYQLIANRPFGYCGDGQVNQIWEECDPGVDMASVNFGGKQYCNEKCQYEYDNQCKDLVLARVNLGDVQDWTGSNLTPDTLPIRLGSSVNTIPRGKWFAISYLGHLITDPDMISADYENTEGLAIERDHGRVRLVLGGSEYDSNWSSDPGKQLGVKGDIEFWGTTPTWVEEDANDDNWTEQYDSFFIDGKRMEFDLGVEYDDDGVWTYYDEYDFPTCQDYGDAPEQMHHYGPQSLEVAQTDHQFEGVGPKGYPTLKDSSGARHNIGKLLMGHNIDGEDDGQPDEFAASDDDNAYDPDNGDPADYDDEDGVYFKDDNLTLVPFNGWNEDLAIKKFDITSTDFAYVDGWVDFNRDGDWDDDGEQILVSKPVNPGSNWLEFKTPWYAQPGETYARFRISYQGGLSPYGPYDEYEVPEGEVEDYILYIERQNGYCGDGEVNQVWEQCDEGGRVRTSAVRNGCDMNTCQLVDEAQYNCSDLVLATVNFNDKDFTDAVYLGEQGRVLPFGTPFALYYDGHYVTDPNMTEAGYDDVDGISVERQEGKIRTVLSGDRDGNFFDGYVEIWNQGDVVTYFDDSYEDWENPLEDNDSNSVSGERSEMILNTINGGKDGVWSEYSPVPNCDYDHGDGDNGGDNGGGDNGGGDNGGGDNGGGQVCTGGDTVATLVAEGNGETVVFTPTFDPAEEIQIPETIAVTSGTVPSDGSAFLKFITSGEAPIVCEYVAVTGDSAFTFVGCYDDPFDQGIVTLAVIGDTPNDYGPGQTNPTITTESVTLDIGVYAATDVAAEVALVNPETCTDDNGGGDNGGDTGGGQVCTGGDTVATLVAEGNGETVVFTPTFDPAEEIQIPETIAVTSGTVPSDGSAFLKFITSGEAPIVCEYVAVTGDSAFTFVGCYDDPFDQGIVTLAVIGDTPNDYGPGQTNPTITTESVTLDIGVYAATDVAAEVALVKPETCTTIDPTPISTPTPTASPSQSPVTTPTDNGGSEGVTGNSSGGGGGGGRAFCANPPVLSAITPIKNGTYNTMPNITFTVSDEATADGITVKVDDQFVEPVITEGEGVYNVTADTSEVAIDSGTVNISIKANAARPLCWKHASYSITVDADATETNDGDTYEESDFESDGEGSLFSDEDDYLGALTDRGILNSDGDPTSELDRATASKIIAGVLGLVFEGEVETNPFPDVMKDAWYAPYILLLKEQGILKGYGDGLFRPLNTISRAEAYKILYLASDKELTAGTTTCVDLEAGAWYLPYMEAAFQDDVIIGGAEVVCGPHKVITRGEFAELIVRFFGLE